MVAEKVVVGSRILVSHPANFPKFSVFKKTFLLEEEEEDYII